MAIRVNAFVVKARFNVGGDGVPMVPDTGVQMAAADIERR